MSKIMNMTPHPINIIGLGEIPSSGVIRVMETKKVVGNINGIPIIKKSFGSVGGLPDEQPDTFLVVSLVVAQAAKKLNRKDILVVGETIRNEDGRIVGAKSFGVV